MPMLTPQKLNNFFQMHFIMNYNNKLRQDV